MEKSDVEIVVIDDSVSERHPLVITLRRSYNIVTVFTEPAKGAAYVLDTLEKKKIVILDLRFDENGPNGQTIFNQIREHSKIVPVIIWSAANDVEKQEFTGFINEHAFAFLKKTLTAQQIGDVVNKAVIFVNSRVDSTIEEWINSQPEQLKNVPYIINVRGETLSLEQIVREIRLQTEMGKDFEKKFLMLTIDLIMRGKKKLDE